MNQADPDTNHHRPENGTMKDINAIDPKNSEVIRPFDTPSIHKLLLAAIAGAEAAGIDEETLDRMRLACESFTYQAFSVGGGEKFTGNGL